MIERLSALRDARWLPSFLLLCAALILIWLVGPRIAIDGRPLFAAPAMRLGVAIALVLSWCAWQAGRWALGRLDIRLAPAETTEDTSDEARAEAEHLARIRQEDREVRRRLKARTLGELPRYLLLGAPGAGKQALLQQAGLPTHASIGTRPCTWHFCERLVLLAAEPGLPAGAWTRLLRPLGLFRRRRMFHGVVLVISAAELLRGDAAARLRSAAEWRDMLKALLQPLGPSTPVYLVVTHCDALVGFHACFGAMPAHQRAQIWGLNLPLTGQDPASTALEALPPGLDSLTARLHDNVLERLQTLRDKDERARLLGFPLQFAGLGQRVRLWTEAVCAHSRHHPDIRLRGLYFTSARQSGTSVQPWPGTVAHAADVPGPQVAPSRLDYFTAPLFTRVLLPEAGLADLALRRSPRARRWRVALACTGLALLAGLALLLLADRFDQQQQWLRRAGQYTANVNALARRGIDLARPQSMLPLLDASARREPSAPDWPALFWRKDAARLDALQADTRRRVLHQTFAPYVAAALARQMDTARLSPIERYQALRLYLMLADPARLDTTALRDWLRQDLATRAGGAEAGLKRHAEDWIRAANRDEGIVPDTGLVERTRNALSSAPRAPMWWNRLEARLAEAMPGQLTLGQMAGPGAGLVLSSKSGQGLSSGVPLRFTQAGYLRYLRLRDRLLDGPGGPSWVLGMSIPASVSNAEKRELDALYFAAYIKAWDAMLNDVTLSPLDSRQGSAQSLRLLAGPDSPLRRFLLEANRQTRFAPGHPVTEHFSGLQAALTPPPGSKQTALDAVQARLAESATYMDAVQNALQHGMQPPADNDAFGKLMDNARTFPAPLGNLLQGMVRQSGETQRTQLTGAWQTRVAAFCHKALDQRFPFSPRADAEVTLDDFTRLFRPGGLIDEFFQKNLAAQVDTRGPRWRLRTPSASTLSPAALHMFQRAAAIRDAFFPDGGNSVSVGFDVTPERLSTGSARMRLNVGGQSMSYAHGPILTTGFKWPGGPTASTRLEVATSADGPGDTLEYQGAWSLFRLIRKATLQKQTPDRFLLHFTLRDAQVTLRVNARSVNNPFNPALLQGFRCSDAL